MQIKLLAQRVTGDQMNTQCTSAGLKDTAAVTAFVPANQDAWYALGQYAQAGSGSPAQGSYLFKAVDPDALLPIDGNFTWTPVWTDHGSGAKHDFTLLRATPTTTRAHDYTVLGDLMLFDAPHREVPSHWVAHFAAIRNDLLLPAIPDGSTAIWTDRGSGAKDHGSMWSVIPDPGAAGLRLLTFVAAAGYHPPTVAQRPVFTIDPQYVKEGAS